MKTRSSVLERKLISKTEETVPTCRTVPTKKCFPTNQQQSDGSAGLGRQLRLLPTLAGTAGRSVVLSGQQVVFAEVAGLLVGGAYGRLGGRRVLILFTSIQLRGENKENGP